MAFSSGRGLIKMNDEDEAIRCRRQHKIHVKTYQSGFFIIIIVTSFT